MIESVFLQSELGSTLVGCSGIIPLLFASRFTNVSGKNYPELTGIKLYKLINLMN